MNKTRIAILSIASLLLLAACQPTNQQQNNQSKTNIEATKSLNIAYVNLDSVYNSYDMYIKMTADLELKQAENQKIIENKMRTMQSAMAAFQEKLQTNRFTSQQQAEIEQKRIIKMQEGGQKLEIRLNDELMKLTQEKNDHLYETVKSEIAKFNADGKYDLILTNVGIQNILYANESMDITDEIIEHLNKVYNMPKSDVKEEPKEEAKAEPATTEPAKETK